MTQSLIESSTYRAPMRSRRDDVPPGAGVERALHLGLCGMGGRLAAPPASVADALVATDRELGERAARRLERFADAMDGAFVWTRDFDGHFWLGRLNGPWRYDSTPEGRLAHLVHVRPCEWRAVASAKVPAAVSATFARGGRNWQRIRRQDASLSSAALWAHLAPGVQSRD